MRINATVSEEPAARVAGAEMSALHTLPASKFHDGADPGEKVLKMDSMGAEGSDDLSLTACPAEGSHGALIVKVGSAARTHITLPDHADAAAIYGDLEAGQLTIHVPCGGGGGGGAEKAE